MLHPVLLDRLGAKIQDLDGAAGESIVVQGDPFRLGTDADGDLLFSFLAVFKTAVNNRNVPRLPLNVHATISRAAVVADQAPLDAIAVAGAKLVVLLAEEAIVHAQRHEIPYLDDAYYLQQALASGRGGSAIQTTVLVADDLLSEPLEKYKLIYCVNLPAPNAAAAERLRAYLAGGGNVVWICGDNVQPEAYNLMNQQARGQLLPAPLVDVRTPGAKNSRDSWHVSFLDKTYKPLGRLIEPPALYESVLVYKHVRIAPSESDTRVLARLDDGEPLLAMRGVENGKVLMLGVSAHVNWSNLPLRPIFLPLVTRLTFELAGAEQASHSVLAGQPIVLEFPNQSQPVGIEVIPPSGETLRLKTEGVQGKMGQTFRYSNTHDIGVYLVRPLGVASSRPIAYAVNADPDEADPAKIERQELENLLGGSPLLIAENPDDLSGTFALLREGKSLWGALLAAVLVILVFETFISNRLGPKREEPRIPAV